jgi:ATP phosphoribosyltransferase regulatory subunit HisZ
MTRDCCSDQKNLEGRASDRPDMTVRVCRVCGARHLELTVDPLRLGIRN